MKIVHLCTGYPITFNGGITNYVRALASMQVKNGYDVIVIGGKEKETKNLPFKYIEYNDFFLRPFSLKEKKKIFAYKKIEKIISTLKPDLLHIHMMLDIDERIYKILEKYNIKYIVSLHDYSFLCPRIQMFTNERPCECVSEKCTKCAYYIEQRFWLKKICDKLKINKEIGRKRSPQFLKMYEENKKTLENAELLLPVSKKVQEIYEKSNIKNKYKILHIGNITADSFVEYSNKEIEDKTKIKIVMLGSFKKVKGGEEFIKIANSLNETFEFYFLGRANENEKIIMRENGIIDCGEYKQEELPKKLKKYDFGCVLSIWEDNAPQVVMELLNNNIPVIGTLMGGIPDFIEDNQNGFLYNPYSQESFENLIQRLNKLNIEECERMKHNIKRTLTPEEHFKELEAEYIKILKDIEKNEKINN